MPDKKRQRTLVDFNLPKTNVLPGSSKRRQTAPIYIDLVSEDADATEIKATEKRLFVADDDLKYSETLVQGSAECDVRSVEHARIDVTACDIQRSAKLAAPEKLEASPPHRSSALELRKRLSPSTAGKPSPRSSKNSPKPSRVDVEEPGSVQRELVIVEEVDQEQQLLCPVCGILLTKLDFRERDDHCDRCLQMGAPQSTKRTGKPLPKLPKVKKIPFQNHTVIVDGFNFDADPAIKQYFLSHFHADHYMGIKKSWNQGSIYCSKITANLLVYKFKVPLERIVALPENVEIPIASRVSVICFDANHCPGSFVFLFREFDSSGATVEWVLHTGDFRSNDKLIDRINSYTKNASISKVYLDTTYMYPSYHFPLQTSVLDKTAEFANTLKDVGMHKIFGDRQTSIMNFLSKSLKSRHLYRYVFLVGTYTIGKEKLAIAIAQRLGTKIFLPRDTTKHRIVQACEQNFPDGLITHDITKSCVHLVSMHTLASKESLQFYYKPIAHIYEDVIAFSPTGWSFKNGGRFIKLYESFEEKRRHTLELLNDDNVDHLDIASIHSQYKRDTRFQVFRVPYSEHSSFKDLANFCTKLPWSTMIPTVNTHDNYMVREMDGWFKTWKDIQKERQLPTT
ncbi:LADA_0E02388g1_1 [Lachancea dasiensis]|uniref:LADA_0E02388g1_1 n=1 Tax=Lachancea dasiensis TaxID=1072105 RepID=A0A1G4JAQ7_9SACH|nr:LADA_0E02388g1_1 [Lachancea dasiensis]